MIEDNLFLAKTAQFELQTAIQFFDVKPKLYKDKIFPNIMHKIYFKHNNEIFQKVWKDYQIDQIKKCFQPSDLLKILGLRIIRKKFDKPIFSRRVRRNDRIKCWFCGRCPIVWLYKVETTNSKGKVVSNEIGSECASKIMSLKYGRRIRYEMDQIIDEVNQETVHTIA